MPLRQILHSIMTIDCVVLTFKTAVNKACVFCPYSPSMNHLDQLVIDLEVVGQVRSSDKLGVHCLPGAMRLVVDGGYAQSLRRWYNGCSRDSSIDYLNQLVQRCQQTAILILEGQHKNMACAMRMSATRAIAGLHNLQSTFSSDSTIVAQIGLLVNKLQAVVDDIKAIGEEEKQPSPRPDEGRT